MSDNPYADRWRTFKDGADRIEDAAIESEARQAEEMPTIKCGKCGDAAFFRPGVGAYQCGYCGAIRVDRRDKKTYEFLGFVWVECTNDRNFI